MQNVFRVRKLYLHNKIWVCLKEVSPWYHLELSFVVWLSKKPSSYLCFYCQLYLRIHLFLLSALPKVSLFSSSNPIQALVEELSHLKYIKHKVAKTSEHLCSFSHFCSFTHVYSVSFHDNIRPSKKHHGSDLRSLVRAEKGNPSLWVCWEAARTWQA